MPLAGNISITLSPEGLPMAALTHPKGGSCEVLIGGASIVSWRTPDGVERLARDRGGIMLSNLGASCGLEDASWNIEQMDGGKPDGGVQVSVFAETGAAQPAEFVGLSPEAVLAGDLSGAAPAPPAAADGPQVAARITVNLTPSRLSVSLEVANQADEPPEVVGSEAAAPISADCTLRAHCCKREVISSEGNENAAGSACELALRDLGLKLSVDGFESTTLRDDPTCVCLDVAAEPRDVTLGPGQALSGELAFEVL